MVPVNMVRPWNRRLARLVFFALVLAAPALSRADDPARPAYVEPTLKDFDRQHWSFQPLVRPAVPKVAESPVAGTKAAGSTEWPRQPLDHFILARMAQSRLRPAPEADRATLARRLAFDLTGLPPTPDDVARFVADETPDAYERLVERWLTSPDYGAAWAQLWLDVARFAETDGFEFDSPRPEAWRYRDWVIAAWNADLSFDRFVQQQIAGDLLAPDSDAGRIATTFCLVGPDMPDLNNQDERRHLLLNELTATVGSAFLGLQFDCCQCHDHKYDPLSQADFYRLRAFFESSVVVQSRKSVTTLQTAANAPPARLYLRGDFRRPGPELRPETPRVLAGESADDRSPPRVRLARWLTRADQPLTARVIVNRLWQQHFGRGLVPTPSDFGRAGSEPTHPELLDWLASELVQSGWSLKHVQRLIVTSATFRQASFRADLVDAGDREAAREALVGFPRRRLTGEELRDAMLAVAGALAREGGGPGVMPPLPPELTQTLLPKQWQESPRAADHFRRSVYVFARRNLRYPIFEAFDRPDANASCPRRDRSTTAIQSLLLLNSRFSRDIADRLARGAEAAEPTDADARLRWLGRTVFGRDWTDDERSLLRRFVAEQSRRIRGESAEREAWADLCLALLNGNEFVYVD